MSTGAYVGIPTSYTPVEYLESSGTQYIDTGIVRDITKVFRFVAKVKWNDVTTRQCIGAQGYVYFGVSGGKYQIAQGGTTTTNVTATTGSLADIDLTFNCPSSTCTGTVNNTSIGTISATYQNSPADAHIHLFSLNDLVLPCSVQIASFKIYQNNVLVRDFVPALDENNVACMLDLVENKFYYNKGSGNFTYGTASTPVTVGDFARKVKKIYVGVSDVARKVKKAYVGVPMSYTPVEYIESSGTQYIDTGVLPYQTELEVQFQYTSLSAVTYLSGSYNDNNNRYGLIANRPSNNDISYGDRSNNYYTLGTANTNIHTIVYNNSSHQVVYDNVVKGTISDLTTTATRTLYLFAYNASAGVANFASVRIMYCKIKDKTTNTLIRDFIPALDDNNIACLYEQVEGKFYYNSGTGTFTAGSTTGEPVSLGSVARLCFKGTTIWEAFIELCRANPTKSAASRVLQYQTQIESLMAQNGKDVNSYHSIYAHTDGSGFEVIFVVPTTYWYKYNEKVSGNVYAFYISGRSGSQSIYWLSASDIRYYANTSWAEYSNDVIGVFSKASSGGSPSANCVVEVMSE